MKTQVNLSGKMVNIDTDNPKVASALVALVKACAERHYAIGQEFTNANGRTYILSRILQANGTHRAYLINKTGPNKGVARNSDRKIMVQDAKGGKYGRGYVTKLPCRNDKFYDEDNGGFLPQE